MMNPETQQLKESVEMHLRQSGLQEKLKAQLKNRLIEAGWHALVQKKTDEILQSKGGIQSITCDQLFEQVLPFAKDNIPENVKLELANELQQIIKNMKQ